ncbi:MAG: radical SAM protein [Spirochaetaceae bacterium]|jgi:radical SAM superfamily enzyme YgiQ (UPF0313 family)|nr:radical SAM protein [Spirochaetaceae bacterium]
MIYLVQPPFIQLNSPYPSLYYLRSFLEARGYTVGVDDHSIALFSEIFSRPGLERIFTDAGRAWEAGKIPGAAHPPVWYNIERFLSEQTLWLSCIDRLAAFLRGRDGEWGRLLALANGTVPSGPRFDALLDSLNGDPPPDAAPLLAGRLLADLADFLTVTLDPSFSLIRYAESLASGSRDFSPLRLNLDGYVMKTFYRPFLERRWEALSGAERGEAKTGGAASGRAGPLLLLVTIPFPGCLAGALVCAESAKRRMGGGVVTMAGGGYVNTELRFMEEPAFFDYFDFLSFDRGYGSLTAVLEFLRCKDAPGDEPASLYKTLYRSGGRIIRGNRIACGGPGVSSPSQAGGRRSSLPGDAELAALEAEAARTVFPDYRGVDFSQYLRAADDPNPMHRLWTDGRWLKAYLAHGCYWHTCAFCDVTLDYIRGFEPVDTDALFQSLLVQADKTGVRGVHLVDEAAPPASLLRLAELNRPGSAALGGRPPLCFWGNIRFEKTFTPDAAALLAAGGLVGVSGGIEVATENGFRRIGKGIALPEVVRSCAAFKEAGVLTHAYLIYGYWDEDDQEILDSAEILRQLFAAGLLDSAFWHKFVLTCHSRIYAEWRNGAHPGLRPTRAPPHDGSPGKDAGQPPVFACNDLAFEGEGRSACFTEGLDRLLTAWMSGRAETPVQTAFPFKTPPPGVRPETVVELLDEYARARDREQETPPRRGRLLFLGSRPVVHRESRGGAALFWRYRLADRHLRLARTRSPGAEARVQQALTLLEAASREGVEAGVFREKMNAILGNEADPAWKILRAGGLVRL